MSHITDTGPVRPITNHRLDLDIETTPVHEQIVYQVSSLISLGVGLLNGLICLRFLLILLDANRANEFARFVFITTEPFLAAFRGLSPSPAYRGIELELITLLAITVYSLLGWLMIRLLQILFAHPK
jgi:uncharacterized protein YggT (Ycf19 family)